MLVWPKQILSNVWISFAVSLQLNLLDLNRFYGSDIHTQGRSQDRYIFVWLMGTPSWIFLGVIVEARDGTAGIF